MTEGNYKPKGGDRVRVTIEGVVHSDNDDQFELGWNIFDRRPYTGTHEATYTVEKLQDPEPQWVNGDVILISDGEDKTPLIYVENWEGDRFWACAECTRGAHPIQHVSVDWQNGDVEILYKADGAKAA